MNVCFYTSFEISPTDGGTERITHSVANSLSKDYGIKCYSLYYRISRSGTPCDKSVFMDSMKVDLYRGKKEIATVLKKWSIDILICQGSFALVPLLSSVSKAVNVKIVFCHHYEPGWEISFGSFSALKNNWLVKHSLKNLIKLLLTPYYHYSQKIKYHKYYKQTYLLSDRVVLLSEGFIPQFMKFGGIKDDFKFRVIHNALSFTDFYETEKISDKKKNVLIVSRMVDNQKKISIALKIWKEIESDLSLSEWFLHIVGDGANLNSYKRFVEKNKLRRVVFEGAQNPIGYYIDSSLFMMTSISEGWGLTLTEAQQNGCVPIAFDTYASLHDIIYDGYNGFIVPNGDIGKYVSTLKKIMCNSELRIKMAKQSIESSRRFEQMTIGKKWLELFNEITNKKSDE